MSERSAVRVWLCVGTCQCIGGGRQAEAFEEIQLLRRREGVLIRGRGSSGKQPTSQLKEHVRLQGTGYFYAFLESKTVLVAARPRRLRSELGRALGKNLPEPPTSRNPRAQRRKIASRLNYRPPRTSYGCGSLIKHLGSPSSPAKKRFSDAATSVGWEETSGARIPRSRSTAVWIMRKILIKGASSPSKKRRRWALQ